MNENEFVNYHFTGYIPQEYYKEYEKSLDWLGDISRYPILYKTITLKDGEKIELRKTGDELKYVKEDKEGNILRDKSGKALLMSKKEIMEKGLPLYDVGIVAFNKEGKPIGLASNEWGATGIWVTKPYQKRGLGTELLHEYRMQLPPRMRKMKFGQMTSAGINLTKAYYRKYGGVFALAGIIVFLYMVRKNE